jgi:hypothetical protein
MERGSPVTVAGAARDFDPLPSASFALAGPVSRAIRDVERHLNGPRGLVQLWHGAFATDAILTARR